MTDASNNPVYYAVGPYNPFAAARVAPTQPGNDVWIRRGDVTNSTPVNADPSPVTTAQACVNVNIIPLFEEIDAYFLSSGEFEVLSYGDYKLDTNDYVCDADRVFKCTADQTLCQYYTPDVYDFLWEYQPLKTPTQGAQPDINTIIIGKLYSEFDKTPVS